MSETSSQPPQAQKRSRTRVLVEWAAVLGLFLFLTQTRPGTIVRSYMQRGLLATGLFKPQIGGSTETSAKSLYTLQAADLNGDPGTFSDLRGKVVFLNVWATWCSPCLAEMPFIQRLYDEVADERIEFVMLSVDDSRERAAAFIEDRGYSFPVYHTTSGLPPPFSGTTIPSTYVISPQGTLISEHAGMANYDSKAFREHLRDLAKAVTISE